MTDSNTPWRETESGAVFSDCRNYRYALWRTWDSGADHVLFIGLNPSKANESRNDPTIRRCITYARDWGYGGLLVANVYAYCATRPPDLFRAADPVGPDNKRWLSRLGGASDKIICCWGNHGLKNQASLPLSEMDKPLYYLKMNRSGAPAHPLYLRKEASPVLWLGTAF